MILIQQIRDAVTTRDHDQLLQFWAAGKATEIEKCDQRKNATLLTGILEAAVFEETSGVEGKRLLAMLDAIERGNHPYLDTVAMTTINALTPNCHLVAGKTAPASP